MLKKIILAFCLLLSSTAAAWAQYAPVAPAPIKVIYGFDREFPPYTFQEPGGKPVGFEVDLVEAIFNGQNVNLQMRPLAWDMIQIELAGGQISFTSGMVKTTSHSGVEVGCQPRTSAASAMNVKAPVAMNSRTSLRMRMLNGR